MMGKLGILGTIEQGNIEKIYLTKNVKNAFAKHLEIFHPERQGDPSVFKLKVEATYQKCLNRQVSEGVHIANSKADYLMNSKTEFMQPSVSRVIATRQVRDNGS